MRPEYLISYVNNTDKLSLGHMTMDTPDVISKDNFKDVLKAIADNQKTTVEHIIVLNIVRLGV